MEGSTYHGVTQQVATADTSSLKDIARSKPASEDDANADRHDDIMRNKRSSSPTSALSSVFMLDEAPVDASYRRGFQHPLPSSRRSMIRHDEGLHSLGVLDIMRESSSLLRANSSVLMSAMVLFIAPVSALLLSHAFLQADLAHRLSRRLNHVASAAGLLNYMPMMESVYLFVSQTFLTYVLSTPAFFTLWLLAKASITFTVSCTYAGQKASFSLSTSTAIKLWKRLACTYLWICIFIVGFCSMAALSLLVLIGSMDAFNFSADLIFLMQLALGLFYSVIFAQMVVIGSLASVVCILEELHGFAALVKSVNLIKGRIQVALSLFLASTSCMAIVESLYQHRVIGMPKGRYAINTVSRMWEGPLLVLMYSFLWVMDAIMNCVFYFTCQSMAPEEQAAWECFHNGSNPIDTAD